MKTNTLNGIGLEPFTFITPLSANKYGRREGISDIHLARDLCIIISG